MKKIILMSLFVMASMVAINTSAAILGVDNDYSSELVIDIDNDVVSTDITVVTPMSFDVEPVDVKIANVCDVGTEVSPLSLNLRYQSPKLTDYSGERRVDKTVTFNKTIDNPPSESFKRARVGLTQS